MTKQPKRIRKVKGWAIIRRGCITPFGIDRGSYSIKKINSKPAVNSEFKVVPVTITYRLPKGGRK